MLPKGNGRLRGSGVAVANPRGMFAERDDELGVAAAALAEGVPVLVVGEAGIGKTEFARRVAARLRAPATPAPAFRALRALGILAGSGRG